MINLGWDVCLKPHTFTIAELRVARAKLHAWSEGWASAEWLLYGP